jgi:hypothetical protein
MPLTKNPLSALASSPSNRSIVIPPLPKLADEIQSAGNMMTGARMFDQKMENWRQAHQQLLQNQFATTKSALPKSGS